jgi:hypothetical protein
MWAGRAGYVGIPVSLEFIYLTLQCAWIPCRKWLLWFLDKADDNKRELFYMGLGLTRGEQFVLTWLPKAVFVLTSPSDQYRHFCERTEPMGLIGHYHTHRAIHFPLGFPFHPLNSVLNSS